MLPEGGASPPTRDDLRRLEARTDTRLQEVNARIVLHDGRFAAMGDRINQTDRRTDALSARLDSRLRGIDRNFGDIEADMKAVRAGFAEMDARLCRIEDYLMRRRRFRRLLRHARLERDGS